MEPRTDHLNTRPSTAVNRPQPLFAQMDSCWICNSQRLAPISKAHFIKQGVSEDHIELAAYVGYSILLNECLACTFIQPEALPTLPEFFHYTYDQQWGDEWMATEFEARYKDFIFKGLLQRLERRIPVGSRTILDIGAHVGRFIHLASERGWSAEGVELNPLTAAFAHQKTGLPIHRKTAGELAAKRLRFAAVTMTDTLEHIPFPMQILRQVRQLLKPDGWIAVKVPYGRNQLLKERIRSYVKPSYMADVATNLVHVNHFSVQSLTTALRKAGFDRITITVGAPELRDWHGKGWHGKANAKLSNWFTNLSRLSVYGIAKAAPFGARSPLAMNLQAFARKT
jgi:2-polyprenyl-3-methyl-5-hydroxy-6-metoxy-1,4-benzoquinol methylase